MGGLVLEDGRRWGEAAVGFQWDDGAGGARYGRSALTLPDAESWRVEDGRSRGDGCSSTHSSRPRPPQNRPSAPLSSNSAPPTPQDASLPSGRRQEPHGRHDRQEAITSSDRKSTRLNSSH